MLGQGRASGVTLRRWAGGGGLVEAVWWGGVGCGRGGRQVVSKGNTTASGVPRTEDGEGKMAETETETADGRWFPLGVGCKTSL